MFERFDMMSVIGKRTHDLTASPHKICFSDGEYLGNITSLNLAEVFHPKESSIQPFPPLISPPR
jgi:hypothetical protein